MKKRKTSKQFPSNDSIDETPTTDSNDSNHNPDSQTTPDEPTSGSPINASLNSQATVEDPTVEIYIGRQPYILDPDDHSVFLPWATASADWPPGMTSLPDSAHMSAADLDLWYQAVPEIKDKLTSHNGKATREIQAAELHMKFKRTLLHEPDSNFSNVWINDGTVFDADITREVLAILGPAVRNG